MSSKDKSIWNYVIDNSETKEEMATDWFDNRRVKRVVINNDKCIRNK